MNFSELTARPLSAAKEFGRAAQGDISQCLSEFTQDCRAIGQAVPHMIGTVFYSAASVQAVSWDLQAMVVHAVADQPSERAVSAFAAVGLTLASCYFINKARRSMTSCDRIMSADYAGSVLSRDIGK